MTEAGRTYWLETLGCPKNQVDSDKLRFQMEADGLSLATDAGSADVVVVNTCAFVEDAREESIGAILSLSDGRADGAELVVTGCLAERSGDELAEAMPEIDRVVGIGSITDSPAAGGSAEVGAGPGPVPVMLRSRADVVAEGSAAVPLSLDLLDLPRPPVTAPWAYVKIAEGCDRACGFCAIPSFRGPQVSRSIESICNEVDQLGAKEIVLVAQDLASFGRDQGQGTKDIVKLVEAVGERVDWLRLLYLYPSELTDGLIEAMLSTGVPYFDLSLQHVSAPLMRRMRRWGNGEKFLERIERIRSLDADAAFRSNFIVGYPGETEEDHDELLEFVDAAQLDWCGFFPYSREPGTHADTQDGHVDPALAGERLAELSEAQDLITAQRQDARIGSQVMVLVDAPGVARSTREAPEIDGVIHVPESLPVGEFAKVEITQGLGVDLEAEPV